MTKLDYLRLAMTYRLYQHKLWILSAFTVVVKSAANERLLSAIPGVVRRDDQGLYFVHPETSEVVRIEDEDPNKELFYKHEKITIDDSFYHGVKSGTVTTVGILLLNKVVFWESFDVRVKYQNGLIEAKHVKKIISDLMVDNPKPGESVPEGKASVDECLKLTKQANYLEGCNEIFVKSGSLQALDVNDKVIELRDRLFEENKDKLHDAVVVADIIKQVVEADAEDQLNGDSADFFIDKKFIDNARKKMFLVFGLERDFTTGEFRLIKTPLNENWDSNLFVHYVNTAISASYDRGKSTGEGGADVNALIRLVSRIRVSEEDCGTTNFELITLNSQTLGDWDGSYYFDEKGVTRRLSKGDTQFIGQPIKMRVPHMCAVKNGDHCHLCCGDALGSTEAAISAEVPLIGTDFMIIKMKNAHVSKVDTVKLDLLDILQ